KLCCVPESGKMKRVHRRENPQYQPGDQVWLSTRDLRLRLPCHELSPHYIGPFKILRQINEVTYQLQLPPRYRIHPTFHNPPKPELELNPLLEQPTIYTVHEILESRHRGGWLEYLIDWEGYGPEERSWIARGDILDPCLLQEFHRNHPNCPAPCSRDHPRRRVRASGATPGGGGNLRHSPQPPTAAVSPEASHFRSESPEF
ncbi:hypothetical protein M9458_053111, partial [Cirrhinus mrigala]